MAFQEYLETSIGIDIHQQQELQNFDKKVQGDSKTASHMTTC